MEGYSSMSNNVQQNQYQKFKGRRILAFLLLVCMLTTMMPAALAGNMQTEIGNEAQCKDYAVKNIWPSPGSIGFTLEENDDSNDINVFALQYALQVTGYYNGKLDGGFGRGTSDAVSDFQSGNGLKRDGKAGQGTLGKLFPLALAKVNGTPATPTPTPTNSGNVGDTTKWSSFKNDSERIKYVVENLWTVTNKDKLPTLRIKDNLKDNMNVFAVQYALYTIGYTAIKSDGSYGEATSSTVATFQKGVNLDNDGNAGPATLAVLYPAALSKYYSTNPTASPTPTPPPKSYEKYSDYANATERNAYVTNILWKSSSFKFPTLEYKNDTDVIKDSIYAYAVQYTLFRLGYLSEAEADGNFGAKSKAAVEKFQTDNKSALGTVDGIVGEKTYEMLFTIALNRFGSTATPVPTTGGGLGNATNAGSSPSAIAPSAVKTYVQLSDATVLFTSDEYRAEVTAPKGSVLQLVAYSTYTKNNAAYFSLYYNNKRYNVRATDIISGVLTDAQATSYVINTLWKQNSFAALRQDYDLVGDIRVHGLQYALTLMGYYDGSLDGNFGSGSQSAVKAFQRAYKLDVDGSAGDITQKVLYPLALARYTGGSISNSGSGGGGGSTTSGSLKTTASVNLRKSASTSSARLAVVPKNLTLSYYDTKVSGNVTWYKVVYNGKTGWLMGSFVSASGGGSGGGGSSDIVTGTVTITLPGTRVRKTPGGDKTGVVLGKGTVVPLLGNPVTSGGYTWYHIKTASGVMGYVRGDCATASSSGGSITPSTSKTYVRLPQNVNLFTTEELMSGTPVTTVNSGTVLQMVSPVTYTKNNVEYCSVYYQNKSYNAVYADLRAGILSSTDLTSYITGTLWPASYSANLKESFGLVGDIRVHALQYALQVLGYYTGTLDGNFGSATTSALKNFQRKNKLTVDGSLGPNTYIKLFPMAISAYNGGGGSGGGSTAGFGPVTSVKAPIWNYDSPTAYMPKSSTATVMDVQTGKVFTIYRWSGGNHMDSVPYTAADTKTMCDIVGFPYNSSHPDSSQLSKIKSDSGNNNATYTWPDFKGTLTGAKSIGSAWDRRPALLNVNGTVYPVSIYGWPHGYNGTDTFSKSTINGQTFSARSNYYGMMCVWFYNSKGHGNASTNAEHNASVKSAYNYAKQLWPNLTSNSTPW